MELPLSIPGSFLPDHDSPSRPTLKLAPVNSSIFLPPQSPSAASSLSRSIRAIPRTVSTSSDGSRKRARLDDTNSTYDTSCATGEDETRDIQSSFGSAYASAPSPAPLVNTNYRIAGGLDTPTAESAYDWEQQNSTEAEQDYRPTRFAVQVQQRDSYFPQTPALLSREGNGHKRAYSTSERTGWGRTVWACTGGFAGKVINFCWSSAFGGFQAGGGTGYHINTITPSTVGSYRGKEEEEKDVFHANYRGRGSTPVPGGFPPDAFISGYMSNPQSYQDTDLATPTQHNDTGDGSILGNNWVVIKDFDVQSRETSPVRKKSRWTATAIEPHRPISRASMANRPRLTPSRPSLTNASFASPRGNGALSRPSTSDGPVHGHRRSRSSIASPRRSDYPSAATPTSPEVTKYEKKVRRQEKVQDENIKRLNRQLKDMIREGKQALGTRVEIQDETELEDEGYGEGTEIVGESRRWH